MTAKPSGGGTKPLNPLKAFLADNQDPQAVQQAHGRVSSILTSNEQILYIAVQKPLVSLTPDCVVLTNRRFILYHPTLLGGAHFQDYLWIHLANAHLSEGPFNATLSFHVANGARLQIDHLPKQQARRLYSFAQEMEEKVRLERRQLELEEKRAAAGGVVLNSPAPVPTQSNPVPADDPVAKLQKLKTMLDAGLITSAEYEAKKAEILSRM